jgi:hypothetical protein
VVTPLFPPGRILAAGLLAFLARDEQFARLLGRSTIQVVAALEALTLEGDGKFEFLQTDFADVDCRFHRTGHRYFPRLMSG